MPRSSPGSPVVTCSPLGGTDTVRYVTARLVLAASTPMFPRASPAGCGTTDQETWLAASP
jgi:hypothetical protein